MSFEAGTLFAGKYRVERVLGEGGMGLVLAARHLGFDELVAIKLIKPELMTGPTALGRFQREARAIAKLRSEHVGRVHDVDALPDGTPYLVLEYVDGTDLHTLLAERGRLPAGEAAAYVLQACEGLAEAHALGMVHRDLKPSNLLVAQRRDGSPLVKVLDFGVVKVGGGTRGDSTLTEAATMVGSLPFMSPEQIMTSSEVDARADVWSLGVCLYQLVTGRLPFEADQPQAVCAAILGRPAPDAGAVVPGLDAAFVAVIDGALAKELRRRTPDVAALAAGLAPFAEDGAASAERVRRILGVPVAPSVPPPPARVTEADAPIPLRFESAAAATIPVAPARVSANRYVTLGLGLGLGLAAAGAVLLLARPRPASSTASAPAVSAAALPSAASPPPTEAAEPEPAPPAVAAPVLAPAVTAPSARPAGTKRAPRPARSASSPYDRF